MGCRTGVALSMSRSAVTLKKENSTSMNQAQIRPGSQCRESCSAGQPAPFLPYASTNPTEQESHWSIATCTFHSELSSMGKTGQALADGHHSAAAAVPSTQQAWHSARD